MAINKRNITTDMADNNGTYFDSLLMLHRFSLAFLEEPNAFQSTTKRKSFREMRDNNPQSFNMFFCNIQTEIQPTFNYRFKCILIKKDGSSIFFLISSDLVF